MTRTAQVDAVRKARTFTSWLMVTGQIGVDAEQLCDTGLRLGNAGRLFCPYDHRWFTDICAGGPPQEDLERHNMWGHPVSKLRFESFSWQRVTLLERTYMRR